MLPLGGCDLVFGTQSLSTLGVISQQVLLHGLNTPKGFEVQDEVQFFKEPTRKGFILQITAKGTTERQSSFPPEITTLLQEFHGVFATPVDLPPMRGHEH